MRSVKTPSKPTPKRAIEAAGGVAKLAKSLEISYEAVRKWKFVPVERVLEIERLTGIPRHEIRPDIYPADTAETA